MGVVCLFVIFYCFFSPGVSLWSFGFVLVIKIVKTQTFGEENIFFIQQ